MAKGSFLSICFTALILSLSLTLGCGGGIASAATATLPNCYASNTLCVNQTIPPSYSIGSTSGQYKLIMQYDGNLVLYNNWTGRALWASCTNRGGYYDPNRIFYNNYAVLQSDGNFDVLGYANNYLYSGVGLYTVFDTRTDGYFNDYLIMQNDGNAVIYNADNGHPLWASNTYRGVVSSTQCS